MLLALTELAAWEERQAPKSPYRFKACSRRKVQPARESVGKGFPEEMTFGLRPEGGERAVRGRCWGGVRDVS